MGDCGGWLLPAAVRVVERVLPKGTLGRSSGEEDEEELLPRNCDRYEGHLALKDTDTLTKYRV